jgi:serine/threonine protein kinase
MPTTRSLGSSWKTSRAKLLARAVFRSTVKPARAVARSHWLDPAVAGDFERSPKPRHRTAISRNAGDLVGDRYELRQRFGAGFSKQQAWTALDRPSGEHVVLTFWPTNTPSTSEAIQQSIAERAELKHPGVVPIREILAGEDHVVVVSDVVDGVPLESAGQLSPRASVKVMIGVLDAVAALHARGFVHADLKLENILIVPGDRPVLIDVGAAALEESGRAQKASAPDDYSGPLEASDDVHAAGPRAAFAARRNSRREEWLVGRGDRPTRGLARAHADAAPCPVYRFCSATVDH